LGSRDCICWIFDVREMPGYIFLQPGTFPRCSVFHLYRFGRARLNARLALGAFILVD